MGAPWQGGVQIIEPHKEAGKLWKHPVKAKSGLEVAYYPNFSRFFGLVQLIFSYQGGLWFLIEGLEGAEKQRFGRVPWQNRIIPNWAYLRTKANGTSASSLKSRLEVFSPDDIGAFVSPRQTRTSHLGLLFDFTGAQLTMVVYRTTMCLTPNRSMSSLETSTATADRRHCSAVPSTSSLGACAHPLRFGATVVAGSTQPRRTSQ